MVELGTVAPDFALQDAVSGRLLGRDDIFLPGGRRKAGLLAMFVCVHCPYVKHVEAELGRIGRDYYGEHGEGPLGVVAIQSNDIVAYPEDRPEAMREQAERLGWTFPYLLDESQEVARAFGAACTPDFFLFDRELRLVYRGQLDSSRPRRKDFGNDEPVTGRDLRAALDAVVAGRAPAAEQTGSLGCNIKWKE